MIDAFITFLIIIMIPAAVFQPTAQRFFAAIVFVVVIHTHDYFFANLDGLMYYASDALFLLLVATITSGIANKPQMVVTLQKVCMFGVVANTIGWLFWYLYVSAIYYNMAFIIIYGWAFFTLTKADRHDTGGYTLADWRSCFRYTDSSIYQTIFRYKSQL